MAAPNTDSQRLYGGFRTLQGGVDMGTDPSLLADSEAAFASNLSFRGDLPRTRQPWLSCAMDRVLTGLFQGAALYVTDTQACIVLSVSGRLYRLDLPENDPCPVVDITPVVPISTTADFTVPAPAALVTVAVTSEVPFGLGDLLLIDGDPYTVFNRAANALDLVYTGGALVKTVPAGAPVLHAADSTQYKLYSPNPATLDFVWLFQAEKYLIALGRQQRTVIYDGASASLAGPQGIPSGLLGLYAWGRIWVVLPDGRSFVAGDIVYGPSGTPAQGFVDAILSFTENDFLNEGGFFGVPTNSGVITAIQTLATIDTSLGIGRILVGTPNSIISVNAPTDRTAWKNLTYPIETVSLLDFGTLGPRFTIPVNNDMWYRSVDGLRSFIVARRETTSLWGNTPLSHEVSPILENDAPSLLFYGSMMLFDNRVFATVAPRATLSGVVHDGLAVINFDALSVLGGKQPPIWEGLHSGLAVLQLLRGRIRGEERAFAFALNESSGAIELWELLREGSGFYDTYRLVSGGETTLVRTFVRTVLETKRYVYDRLVKLVMAELYLDDVVDDISLRVLWKPDQYPAWVVWATISLCASVSQCTVATPGQYSCQMWKPNARTYAARLRLPRPPEDCNVLAGIPLDRGYEFQFRLEGTGHFRLRKFRPHLRVQTDAQEGECPSTAICTTFPDCPAQWTDYHVSREVPP